MNTRRLARQLLIMLAAGGMISCGQSGSSKHVASAQLATPAPSSSVKTIALPHFQANLPPGPERDAFARACLTCHTTRYITIQPPLTAAKWEENVRKMIKTYGATIADEQVPKIVQYLMATKEASAGKPARWESRTIETWHAAPKLSLATDDSQRQADLKRGQALFAADCASCHGPQGKGDGRNAGTLLPRASDLTAGHYSPQFIADTVRNGMRGTPMPMNLTLSDEDLRAVATYVISLGPKAEKISPNDQGAALFAKNCVACHGPTGAGDGIASIPMPRPAANFHAKQPTMESALGAITDGIPGGGMPAWRSKLNDAERQALAEYVRSFYAAAQ
jgi:mono/diheme cytochrome c family protein